MSLSIAIHRGQDACESVPIAIQKGQDAFHCVKDAIMSLSIAIDSDSDPFGSV
jgi:hypothetical protein